MNHAVNIRQKNTGILLVAMSGACFGFIPLFTKMAYSGGTNTATLLFLRFFAGSLFLLLLIAIKKKPFPSRREILSYLLLGAGVYFGQSLCYFTALKHTSSSVVALLFYTYPAFVMAGSALFFKERITPAKVLSLILTLFGAFLIVGSEFQSTLLGILLSLLCAIIYSIYILISSRVVKPGMGLQSSAFIMLGVALVYVILAAVTGFTFPSQVSGYTGIVLLAVISTSMAFWSFFAGLEKVGPSTASLVSVTEPVVVVISSVLFLSEPITLRTVIGGLLILSALFIISIQEKRGSDQEVIEEGET